MSQLPLGYANLTNLKVLESLYEKWLENPSSVDPSWQHFFEGMQFASKLPQALPVRQESSDLRIFYLIEAYRTYGHKMANCNVIATEKPEFPEELNLANFGFTRDDLNKEFPPGGILPKDSASLSEIIQALENTYCRTIGIEYMDLGSMSIEKWIQSRIEPGFPTDFSNEEKIEIFNQLNRAEGFETFVHTKYVGQKRFSLEGAETFIPILAAVLETGAKRGVSDVILGMAHRGRLNVLANIMGKSYGYIFEEFEDYYTPDLSEGTGDVKYHMGFAGTYKTKDGKAIQVILSANPSHLESVNPVVEGGARALQEQKGERAQHNEVVPILVHGDAALSGQGVIYETLTLRNLNGYGTCGTIHIVINNQIGFTTLPKDSRSTPYCTDVAKAFGAPILHVSAEDPEACVLVARLALELRQEFGCDVFIDLMGYRKYGHNESDEPTFTQPLQYQLIRSKKSIREIYREHLIETGVLSADAANGIEESFREELTRVLETVQSEKKTEKKFEMMPKERHLAELLAPVETKIDLAALEQIGKAIAQQPENVNLHPKVQRLLQERQKMLDADPSSPSIDWGMGEMLSYASLCMEGTHIRLSGQDVRRGTFSHRHALYVDQVTSEHYFPLSHISPGQVPCDIFNSALTEYATMGFEFGYSLMYPNSLVLWEAQFGDFANGGQIIIDQYFATAEMKWGHATNITFLLPHGNEGMGPEHTSARIERFLQLAADENMIVANCTTPGQLFHILRRQARRTLKKPLALFTPKSTLRHPLCKSPINAFISGTFEEVLDDPEAPKNPQRILFCSGKFYYELIQEREKRKSPDVILRIEQIYPLHKEKIKALIAKYSSVCSFAYVQEEHENMGAWSFLSPYLNEILEGAPIQYIGRRRAASPAAGSHALHKLEHEKILDTLFSKRQES